MIAVLENGYGEGVVDILAFPNIELRNMVEVREKNFIRSSPIWALRKFIYIYTENAFERDSL